MIPTFPDVVLLAAALFLAVGMTWKAIQSRENRIWNAVGALGWGLLALSTFTDGLVQIGIAIGSVVVFVLGIALRRTGIPHRRPA